jgi:hypothetical protein
LKVPLVNGGMLIPIRGANTSNWVFEMSPITWLREPLASS